MKRVWMFDVDCRMEGSLEPYSVFRRAVIAEDSCSAYAHVVEDAKLDGLDAKRPILRAVSDIAAPALDANVPA